MSHKDEHDSKIGKRFHEQNEAYGEFEEVQAEGEATIQYRTEPRLTYRRLSFKARRTRATIHQGPQKEPRSERCGDGGSPRSQSCRRDPSRSWIPRAVPSQRGSVSSVSLQVELEAQARTRAASNSLSNLAIRRKRLGSRSHPTKKISAIQQRLDSAKEIQIKDLSSKVTLLEAKIHELTAENKTLKTGFQRQAAALQKYEGAESDFPKVLTFHQNEVKYLQQTLRKSQAATRKYETTIRHLDNRIVCLEDQNRKYQALVESNELEERHKLQRRVVDISRQLCSAHESLAAHARQFELLQKNHAHQLSKVEGKLKASDSRVFDAEQELYRLTELIHQKDRVISYLRMRSRDPGLEPPLHKKVMEEFKSSYKYFYEIEQPLETVPGDRIRQSSVSDAAFSDRIADEIADFQENRSGSKGQSAVSSPAPRGHLAKYAASNKSNDTVFSEELALHSRERNLDASCHLSDFEEVEEEGEFEFEDDENGTVGSTAATVTPEGHGDLLRSNGHDPNGRRSGTTYILYKNDDDSEVLDPEFLVMDVQSSGEDNEEYFQRPLSSDRHFEAQNQRSKEQRSRIPVRVPEAREPYQRLLGSGDTGEEEEPPEPEANQNERFQSDDAGREAYEDQCSDSYSEGEEMTKYSEEEFYCESGGENENESAISQRQQRFSDPSRYPIGDKQYFAFSSKAACVDVCSDDESQSEAVSKHDMIFTNLAEGAEMDRSQFFSDSRGLNSNASASTANSNNSLAILHALRPKGRGPLEITPSDSREYSAESEGFGAARQNSAETEQHLRPTRVDPSETAKWYSENSAPAQIAEKPDPPKPQIASRQPSKESFLPAIKARNPIPLRSVKKPAPKQPIKFVSKRFI